MIELAESAPPCARCGEPKTAQRGTLYLKGYRWVCYPCNSSKIKFGLASRPPDAPKRTCQACGLPMAWYPASISQSSPYWQCGNCRDIQSRARKAAVKTDAELTKLDISARAIREYRACERRWKEPVNTTCATGTNRGCHKNQGFKNPVLEGWE